MNDQWIQFLCRVGIGAVCGLVAVLLINRTRPQWQERWLKFVVNRRWKWFTFSALFFGAAAVIGWMNGEQPTAIAGAVLCLLSIVSLIRQGFKPMRTD